MKFLIKSASVTFNRIPLISFLLIGLFFGSVKILYADNRIYINNARISNTMLGCPSTGCVVPGSSDTCATATEPGTVCTICGPAGGCASNGYAIYAGSWGGQRYITTPSGCAAQTNPVTSSFSPTCAGGTDPQMSWADSNSYNGLPSAYQLSGSAFTGATDLTNGQANTTALLNYGDTFAARYCNYMSYGGYSTGWYLPSGGTFGGTDGELWNVLYLNSPNCTANGSTGCITPTMLSSFNTQYFSSTEYDASRAIRVLFSNGTQSNLTKTFANRYVRCVRKYP